MVSLVFGNSEMFKCLNDLQPYMADENLRRTIWIFDGKFEELLYRPIGDILVVAVIWSFYYGIRRSRRESRRLALEEAQQNR